MKIIVVDDEEDIRKIARLSLEAIGKFQVVLASSAAEGLAAARTERPDLILMDMMMPGMDGLEALALLQATAELQATPVVFMTAKVQREEIAQYLKLGAIGVIQKPFDPMTLPGEIKRLMETARPPRG